MQTRFRKLHTEIRDGVGSIELEISGERKIYRSRGLGDRANLHAWLKQTVIARSTGTEHSSASSQSKCSTGTTETTRITGHASAQSRGGRTEKLDMHETD